VISSRDRSCTVHSKMDPCTVTTIPTILERIPSLHPLVCIILHRTEGIPWISTRRLEMLIRDQHPCRHTAPMRLMNGVCIITKHINMDRETGCLIQEQVWVSAPTLLSIHLHIVKRLRESLILLTTPLIRTSHLTSLQSHIDPLHWTRAPLQSCVDLHSPLHLARQYI
jgi:hypothetical protein